MAENIFKQAETFQEPQLIPVRDLTVFPGFATPPDFIFFAVSPSHLIPEHWSNSTRDMADAMLGIRDLTIYEAKSSFPSLELRAVLFRQGDCSTIFERHGRLYCCIGMGAAPDMSRIDTPADPGALFRILASLDPGVRLCDVPAVSLTPLRCETRNLERVEHAAGLEVWESNGEGGGARRGLLVRGPTMTTRGSIESVSAWDYR